MMVMKGISNFLKPRRWMHGGAIIGVFVSLSWASDAVLTAIIPPGSPVIDKKQISYEIKFVFDSLPKRYWSYPDLERKMVVIEMYDTEIKVDDSVKLNIVSPLKGLEVQNSSTALVLSGKKSRLFVYLKEDMNSESTSISDTLVLKVWKYLPSRKKPAATKRRTPLIPVIVVLLCAGLTTFFIQSIATEN